MNPTARPLTEEEIEEIQDREDLAEMDRRREELRSGKAKAIPLADVLKKYGMERKNAA